MIVDRRADFAQLGVDYGADADALVIDGLKRLVWTRWHRTLVGARGLSNLRDCPSSLQIRTFSTKGGGMAPETTIDLLVGGRLTAARLRSVADRVDAAFGPGTAALVSRGRTLVLSPDLVTPRLERMRAEAERLGASLLDPAPQPPAGWKL